MSEPRDMIIPLLQDMREEMRSSFERVDRRFSAIESRLDGIEKTQATFKAALASDTLMTRLVTGDYEMRLAELERRTKDLMGGR